MAAWTKNWKIALMVVGFVIMVLLVSDFNHRMAELRRLSAEKELVSTQVASLVETQQFLQTQVAYATSEVAVYKWAYTNRRMTEPGDTLIVPIQPENSAPQPTPAPLPTPEVIHNWQVWLSLFVDEQ